MERDLPYEGLHQLVKPRQRRFIRTHEPKTVDKGRGFLPTQCQTAPVKMLLDGSPRLRSFFIGGAGGGADLNGRQTQGLPSLSAIFMPEKHNASFGHAATSMALVKNAPVDELLHLQRATGDQAGRSH